MEAGTTRNCKKIEKRHRDAPITCDEISGGSRDSATRCKEVPSESAILQYIWREYQAVAQCGSKMQGRPKRERDSSIHCEEVSNGSRDSVVKFEEVPSESEILNRL